MNSNIFFKNRTAAGKDLAEKLSNYKGKNVIVFGLPRGGVVVAYEIAKYLNVELQVLPVRKLALPEREELAVGAISFDGTIVLNEKYIGLLNVDKKQIDKEIENEKARLKEMKIKFRKNQPLSDLKNKIAIVVDDGIATGYTAKVALKTLQKYNPKELILATSVIDKRVYGELSGLAASIVGNITSDLYAIGMFYQDFQQVSDDEVLGFLNN
ncbi:phosphoribosyltransferase [Pseudomonadota bacterium]